jgi:NNP family nitrate/nitrite transporter-like MFS transporter
MSDPSPRRPTLVLAMNTIAFAACFAAWTVNGVLVTFLVDQGVFAWNESQVGLLIGLPILTGSLMRLPLGLLTDRFGGRWVFAGLMLLAAVPLYLLSFAQSYQAFAWCSLAFGLAGASFAVGVAYTSLFFTRERQGTALGIFGIGNAGAALTTLIAPTLLVRLTNGGASLDAWRTLPRLYAALLVVTAVVFAAATESRRSATAVPLAKRLSPLRRVRVWRFGLYYFLVFGGFVGLSQWLMPYYVNVYGMAVTTAGFMASSFSLPSSLVRAAGGWLSDTYGARRVMYVVLTVCAAGCLLLSVPRMDVESPGRGVMAARPGVVTAVDAESITVGDVRYPLQRVPEEWLARRDASTLVLPTKAFWQMPVVGVGDHVNKRQLIARGITHIYFQANVAVFSGLLLVVGFMMGLGMGAVFKHIPDYFPSEVGVVGGIVGVIGGLGGFLCPMLFGALLQRTGLWTTCWMFFGVLSLVCLAWMHVVIQRMQRDAAPGVARRIEQAQAS